METLLHISDIHFGWDGSDETRKAERTNCLKGLITAIKDLDTEWKPTIICLSGDIGWAGKPTDYQEAKTWLQTLLCTCGLNWSDVVVCPGNHDIQRSVAKTIARPGSPTEADEVLKSPLASQYLQSFEEFTRFCKESGILPLMFGASESQLVGFRSVREVDFIVLNSAWFCKDETDQKRLWMGLPHLRLMEASQNLNVVDYSNSQRLRVALLHHPPDWLHDDDHQTAHNPTGNRPCPWDYLASRSHVILTGHTHGGVRPADRIAQCAWHFTAGSAYAGASHFNSFRLVRLEEEGLVHRSFEFDPRDVGNKWKSGTASPLGWSPLPPANKLSPCLSISTHSRLAEFQQLLVTSANRHIEQRSRLLRPSGQLPLTVHRLVAYRVSEQESEFDARRSLIRKEQNEVALPLYEAIRTSRRTLLLGDLGTGKSTLAAGLVEETVKRSSRAIAVFVPVKELRLAGFFSQTDLIKEISDRVRSNFPSIDVETDINLLLRSRVEVLLILDGLDEIDRDLAARVLKQSAALTDSWPTIQVLATARPIEMVGVSYADWRILHTKPLDDEGKLQFLKQEIAADGLAPENSESEATSLLELIKHKPSLHSIATTPLTIRLLYPGLKRLAVGNSITLGDLLFDLLQERVDGWSQRDDKPIPFHYLEQVIPTPDQKLEIVALLAQSFLANGSVSIEQAKEKLREVFANSSDVNQHLIADEFVQFLVWLGILTHNGETLDFALQPLAEIAAGLGIAISWKRGTSVVLDRSQWRQVSFAAAISRRRGDLEELLGKFKDFSDSLLADASGLPACCYIVTESKSAQLAQHAVNNFSDLQYRPLTYIYGEREESGYNVSSTLWLAGDLGFEWLFNQYLDPRYPIPNAGSAIVGDVFSHWTALTKGQLNAEQKTKLETMVVPYKATGEGHFFGVLNCLALLVPKAFTLHEQIQHRLALIDSPILGPLAAEVLTDPALASAEPHFFNSALLARSKDSPLAALHWLKRNPDASLPLPIIRAAFKAASKTQNNHNSDELVSACRMRIGEDAWDRFSRWFLSSSDAQMAAGAALELYQKGERRLTVIGDGLLTATHVGRAATVATTFLGELIKESGIKGSLWIAHRIAASNQWHGAWPSSWRLLLSNVEGLKDNLGLVAKCVRNLGEYSLPRYPELREEFRHLLESDEGTELRRSLHVLLNNSDHRVRRGAAHILVASFPKEESEALFISIRSRAPRSSETHEWEEFCLTLEFSPGVLEYLQSKLAALDDRARAYANLLLMKNGFDLNESSTEELVRSMSQLGNWHLARSAPGRTLLHKDDSFKFLQRTLFTLPSEFRNFACEKLIELHASKLTPVEKAKCLILTCGTRTGRWNLLELMERITSEKAFANDVKIASDEITSLGQPRPFLGIFEEAVRMGTQWNNVVWELLCDDTSLGSSSEADDTGQVLLAFGLKHPEFHSAIGQSAQFWTKDPRVLNNRWTDAVQWLVLLADEFSQLPRKTIEDSLRRANQPIHCSAATSLIARLGEVPIGVHFDRAERRLTGSQPQSLDPNPSSNDVFDRLKECGRDSQIPHPGLEDSIETSLLLPSLTERQLFDIATQGKIGCLIGVVLDSCYNRPVSPQSAVNLLDIWMKLNFDPNATMGRLRHVWSLIRESLRLGEAQRDAEYLAALDQAFATGEIWKPALAYELFQMRGKLLENQIADFISAYAEHTTYLHEALLEFCVAWIEQEESPEIKQTLIIAAQNAVVRLNETTWRDDSVPNTCAYLLAPTIIWYFSKESSDESEMVFLRALQQLVDRNTHPQQAQYEELHKGRHLNDLFDQTAALLDLIPQTILNSALHRGLKVDDSVVRVFCRLVAAFAPQIPSEAAAVATMPAVSSK